MQFLIKTSLFEGPIATLHEMIEKRSLSVSEFSLASITDEFITFVKNLTESVDKEDVYRREITSFISTASILILLKSKSLLPENLFEEEENRSIEILENQLKAYALIKEASKTIKTIFGKQTLRSVSLEKQKLPPSFIGDPSMDLDYFKNYIEERLSEIIPHKEERKEIKVEKKINISDALNHMRTIIKRLKTFSLKLAHHEGDDERLRTKNKKTVVILFLAMLELVKLGEIDVAQEDKFGDIIIAETVI